ncbi:MAG: hypothetical protein IH946_09275 [Bacteroidetes bacterium]|nr:hypothetical protein [Bacteroidota bacterium]
MVVSALSLSGFNTFAANLSGLTFSISYNEDLGTEGFDGRMLLMISNNDKAEPRFQIKDGPNTQLVFGINVEALKPGEETIFDAAVFGYPLKSIADIPPGEYYVQGLLHKYETFNLKNGHTVKLPMDQGEGQHWNRSPKNLYSLPKKVTIDPSSNETIKIALDQEIPAIDPPKDTDYIKHIRIKSKLLTKFWGRPMYLQANVLVPHDFDKSKKVEYPLMVFHGHFPNTFRGFRTELPDADPNDSVYSERFRIYGYRSIQQKEHYDFYQKWISPDFPRFVVIEVQHQNPYYDDSYAVNSANVGPYGDAITYELIPHVEKLFNCIGEGWGRFLYGGSTGGWEALAVQVFYPDEYNGCFVACPDPIDFRAYCLVDIYKDENAYYIASDYMTTLRPGHRDDRGHISATLQDMNFKELALGDKSRSGGQFDIWQAVYSPVGDDGYPKPIWDKLTGQIDRKVAEYWKENYDLNHIMKRDWDKIGKKLEGKMFIYCGDMDNYYLNNAVALTEEFLVTTKNPFYGGVVDYGDGDEHCWNGDHENPNYISRLRYNTRYLPIIKERLAKTAPKDHKLINWGK